MLRLTDTQLLSAAGLYEEDFVSGKKSFNGASVLLLGRDEVIFNCFPTYKTDAILRRINIDRYDDRETVTCNLVEAYDRLMAFGAKHLSDKFYLEDALRVSLRDKILREVIGNTLVHREFSSSRPATFVIYKDHIACENASKALRCGPVTPDNLAPVSKNPIIARFFKQMGRADELGSGTRNLYHYTRLYSNADPVLEEGDAFQVTVPLDDEYSVDQNGVRQTEEDTPQNTPQKPDQKFDRPDQKPDQKPD